MQRVTRTTIAWLVGLTMLVGSSASAKDVHYAVSDLTGVKILTVKKNAKKKKKPSLSALPASQSQHLVEFLYLGHDDLLVIDEDGARPVEMAYGGNSFSWEGADGLTYVITNYPYENNHARVLGLVYNGFQYVGRMALTHVANPPTPAAGTWDGTLAFAGGATLPLSLQIAHIPHEVGSCISYPTRVQFHGRPFETTGLSICDDGVGNLHAGFFYLDERHDDRWFVSINVTHTVFPQGDVLQGSSWVMSLDGAGGMGEGFFYAERPERFQLLD